MEISNNSENQDMQQLQARNNENSLHNNSENYNNNAKQKSNIFKSLIINLLLFIIFIIAICLGLKFFINSYTNHGKTVKVPDVIDLQTDEGKLLLESNGFEFEIKDTVFDRRFGNDRIIEQFPIANSDVKSGRKIILKVNRKDDETVDLPNIIDMTLRDAFNKINNNSLRIGKISYVIDNSENTLNRVFTVFYNDKEIKVGQKVKKYAELEIALTKDDSDSKTNIPNLLGLNYDDASNKLIENYLNKIVKFDKNIKNKRDSLNAKVYKQNPVANNTNPVNLGDKVEIWFRLD